MSILSVAKGVAKEFEYTTEDVRRATEYFMKEMDAGLQRIQPTMSQIPSYVTAVPDGTEKGIYLAVDLGGTNLRVCSVDLHGDTTFSITQSKVTIPLKIMMAESARELFGFVATQIESFLQVHHGDKFEAHLAARHVTCNDSVPASTEHFLRLGFTFSFAFEQESLNKGILVRWTKGFNIPDAIGKDVCALLQEEIDRLHLPVHVIALVNDTVGTLVARSYTSPGTSKTLLGAIFGTGTNGAYVEKVANITKLKSSSGEDFDSSTGEMIINTEWGSFDNDLHVLPNTPYDTAVDMESVHPGIQMFEKRISGMYLGEIFRHAMLPIVENSATMVIAPTSPIYQQFGIGTSFLSKAAADDSRDLTVVRKELEDKLGIHAGSEDAEAFKILALAIGRRAGRLAGVALAAVVLKSGRLSAVPSYPRSSTSLESLTQMKSSRVRGSNDGCKIILSSGNPFMVLYRFLRRMYMCLTHSTSKPDDAARTSSTVETIDIGVDGSVIEFYPGFEDAIRSTLREVDGIGNSGEKRIRIGIAKDGSGVGAALVARMAHLGR